MTTRLSTSQTIRTKYLPCTDRRGSRVKAWCLRGSLTVQWESALNVEDNHKGACDALRLKFIREDSARYKSDAAKNPWGADMIGGQLPKPDSGYCFVFNR